MKTASRRRLAALALAGCALAASAFAGAEPAAPRPPIPFKQEKQSGSSLAFQSIALLGLAGVAAYGAAVALKRFGLLRAAPGGKERRVRLAESVRLSRRSVLHVVHYRGEELLLAEGEHGVRLLASRADGAPDA